MTDKTDIAALLGKLKFFAGEASCHPDPNYSLEFERLCTPSNILAVLDQIEVVSKSEWKLAGELTDLQMNYNALKAKLANPVMLTDCTFEAVSHMAHWYSEGECVAWVSGAEHVKKQILEAGFTVKGD